MGRPYTSVNTQCSGNSPRIWTWTMHPGTGSQSRRYDLEHPGAATRQQHISKDGPLQPLTFGDDVQHHGERGERSDHVEQGHRVLDGQTRLPRPVVETPDQQGHEEGLEAVDQ
ncbi:hypothetical protein EYF80_025444 [Liparis tanakae]|uniref:Uncharacterized protein n=1 Tax=Liparis tanakae TaxID=230148 RepID=A0A4Z2HHE9_9TELE|nr:hypothetical protein EYF80_025444 [Liparis tanakae]